MTEQEEKQKKALDHFATEMLNSAINGINEAVAQEQTKTNFWKERAEELSKRSKRCINCYVEVDWLIFRNTEQRCLKCEKLTRKY